jgi:hypothetical protein
VPPRLGKKSSLASDGSTSNLHSWSALGHNIHEAEHGVANARSCLCERRRFRSKVALLKSIYKTQILVIALDGRTAQGRNVPGCEPSHHDE